MDALTQCLFLLIRDASMCVSGLSLLLTKLHHVPPGRHAAASSHWIRSRASWW